MKKTSGYRYFTRYSHENNSLEYHLVLLLVKGQGYDNLSFKNLLIQLLNKVQLRESQPWRLLGTVALQTTVTR